MTTSLTITGKNGKIICDATEIKIYLKETVKKKVLKKVGQRNTLPTLPFP
jgi:hypothetical protein